MKTKKDIISDVDLIVGRNSEVTDNTHMDLVDDITDYIEMLLDEHSARLLPTKDYIKKVSGWYMDYNRAVGDPTAPWSRTGDFRAGAEWVINEISNKDNG